MRKRGIVPGSMLVISLLLTSCGILPTEEEFDTAPVVKEYEGNHYNKYTVIRGDMVQKESLTAVYQGTTRVEVLGEGLGVQIKCYRVKKGQKVEVGDVILENYLPEQENIIKKSKREMKRKKLEIRHAQEMKKQELEKNVRLSGGKRQKKSIIAQYDAKIKNCRSAIELLRLDIREAKDELDMNMVGAEANGKITMLDRSFEGGYASENDVLMVIEGKKRNRFLVKTKYASRFKDGQETVVTVGGTQYRVTVKKTGNKNRFYLYPENPLTLKAGVAGTLELVLKEKKDVLYVPAALVYDMGDKKIVYVEDENGIRTVREVTVGERMDNLLEITGGLEENEQIITN